MKMSKLEDVLSKLVLLKRVTDGGLGAKPPAMGWSYGLYAGYGYLVARPPAPGRFFVILWKKIYFNAIGPISIYFYFARVQILLKELDV